MNNKIEILAPAGSYDGMRAALNAGADAVYIGGSNFGARAYANNLEEETLLAAIDEAHIRDKKLYLTVNTLMKEKELVSGLYQFLDKFYQRGLDAVIVQDMGVLHFIHQHFPELPVHASTQTTLTMAEGANLLKPYGVTRLVTARELSLQEIQAIRKNTELEIETFVHGALCYCYSGQCLMSSMIGGRSGNRGRCAQPCRMPYQFYSDNQRKASPQEKYLLSPKDINTVEIIPELVEAGIDSFKIEGRMKRPEYAAAVASIYRNCTDRYLAEGKEQYQRYLCSAEYKKDMLLLQDVYNRGGFSEGYGRTYHGKSMMSLYRPNHSGVLVGEVIAMKGSQVTIALNEKVNAQDILEIRYQEEEGYEFTVKDGHDKGDILTTNIGRRPEKNDNREKNDRRQGGFDQQIRPGVKVFRTKNNQLIDQLNAEYLLKNKQLGIQGILLARRDEPLTLTLSYQEITVSVRKEPVQEAVKQPMTQEKLSAPILKTGDTLFTLDRLTVEMEDQIFVPVAWLNEIRREAIALLQEKMTEKYHRVEQKNNAAVISSSNLIKRKDRDVEIEEDKLEGLKLEGYDENDSDHGFCVSVQTKEQFASALSFPVIDRLYLEYDNIEVDEIAEMAKRAADAGKELYLSLPHICRKQVYDKLKQDLSRILEQEAVRGFLVKNFEEIALLHSLHYNEKQKKLLLHYNMYTYNKEAKELFGEFGINGFTAPVELNFQELKNLVIRDSELIIYGYQPVMISAQCLVENAQSCKRCRQGNTGRLVDRLGKSFFVQTRCSGCYNIIYNTQVLSLLKQEEEIRRLAPKKLRLDFTRESEEEMRKIITAFHNVFHLGHKNETEFSDYTTGHFKRGVE